jgi:hypothetical protein
MAHLNRRIKTALGIEPLNTFTEALEAFRTAPNTFLLPLKENLASRPFLKFESEQLVRKIV